MGHALIGTKSGVYQLDVDALIPLGLHEHQVSALFAFKGPAGDTIILAGTYGGGLFRSDDAGGHWSLVSDGLTAPAFRTIRQDPHAAGAVLCGAEPGRIFRSVDGGISWREFTAIPELPGSDEWFLPYSPRAGAVRNIYSPPESDRLLASVEVGGLLESPDRGQSWTIGLVAGDSDIHYVTGHPVDRKLLYAALGWASLKSIQRSPDSPPLGGVARSRDGGASWEKLQTHYTRAVIVPPTRPDLLLAGPAERVGGAGRIEVSHDGGDTWLPAGGGIESPMEDMVEEFLPAPDGSIAAICSQGRLYRAEPGDWQWESVLPAGSSVEVRSVAFLPDD